MKVDFLLLEFIFLYFNFDFKNMISFHLNYVPSNHTYFFVIKVFFFQFIDTSNQLFLLIILSKFSTIFTVMQCWTLFIFDQLLFF